MALDALLAALKKSSASPSIPNDPDADGPDVETPDDAADDSAMDAQVGAALREQNPKMYARLAAEVSGGDAAGDDADAGLTDLDMPQA